MEEKSQIQTGLPDSCILLGGQPRSGTTMLSSILRCTPGHFQAFELHMRKPSFVRGLDGRYTRNIFKELDLPPREFDQIVAQTDAGRMNLGAWVGPKEEVSAEQLTGGETGDFAGEFAARAMLVTKLLRRVAQIHGKQRWGFNILGDLMYADIHAAAWPNATFIHVIRDPRDQAMSILQLNEQREVRGQQSFYVDYRHAAQGWCRTIGATRRVIAANDLRCVEVKYEDLTMHTDKEIARLSQVLDLDIAHGLNFYEQGFVETHTKRFKHHDNLRKAVHTGSVGRWREGMSQSETEIFYEVAGELMTKLGYPR